MGARHRGSSWPHAPGNGYVRRVEQRKASLRPGRRCLAPGHLAAIEKSRRRCRFPRASFDMRMKPEGDETMRFIIIPKPGPTDGKAGEQAPFDEKVFAAYMKYNEDMYRAGVLLASEGLNPA